MKRLKIYKRFLTVVFVISLVLSMLGSANATFGVSINSDWEGNIYGGEVYYLKDKNTCSGSLVIPASYENEDGDRVLVHYAGAGYQNYLKLTSVRTSAPLYKFPTFSGCKALQSVEIPSTVTSFYMSPFSGCSSLKSIDFKNVEDSDAEENDRDSESLLSMPLDMCLGCTSLQSIDIPDTVKTIEGNAFSQCTSLKDVQFPTQLTLIKNYAFSSCSSLAAISLPSKLQEIDDYAFSKCALKSVTIPATVSKIYPNAFANNPQLKSISFLADDSAKALVMWGSMERYSYDPFKIDGVENSTRTIHGPTGGSVEKFAKHWGYQFNSTPAETKFTFGKDNYAFANIASSFASSDGVYNISDTQLAMLTEGYPKSFVAELKEQMNKPFYGMCYGMSTTAALFYTQKLSQSKVQAGASTTYSLSKPSSNDALRELLAVYQLSQFQQSVPDYSISNETPNNLALVKMLKDSNAPVVFVGRLKEGATYSHAMLAYELAESTNGYEIKVYDPNHPSGPLTLKISTDFKTSDFSDTYSSVYVKNSISESAYSNGACQAYVASGGLIKLSTNYDSMTITAAGKTATIKDGIQTGGDLSVSCLGQQNEYGEIQSITYTFTYDYSDGGLRVVPVDGTNEGSDYTTEVHSDGDDGSYISARTVYDSPIIIERDGKVNVSGKKSGKFKVSSTSNSSSGKLYTITAEGIDTGVTIVPTQSGGTVVSENNTPIDLRVSGAKDAVQFNNLGVSSKGADIKTNGDSVAVTDTASGRVLAKGVATDDENDYLQGFVPKMEYKVGQFGDISENAWYSGSVKLAYQLGIISGTGNGRFNPDEKVTLAQAIKMACIVHSVYAGDNADFTQGDPWFQVYVDYAIKNGLIKADQFPDYTNPATRAEMATIFANGVPATELKAKNSVKAIPDVAENAAGSAPIYLLYRAGVLTGNDAQGTFAPSTTISRAQAAAIITRVAVISERRILTF